MQISNTFQTYLVMQIKKDLKKTKEELSDVKIRYE